MSFARFLYAIPYTFVKYNALDISDNVKEELKKYLKISIQASLNSNYPLENKNYLLSNLLCFDMPEESILYSPYWQQKFLKHFDEIFAGTYELNQDKGLIATMIGESPKAKEISNDELQNFLLNFGPIYLDGWLISLEGSCDKYFNDNKDDACKFLGMLAKSGDLDACYLIGFARRKYFDDKELIIYALNKYFFDNDYYPDEKDFDILSCMYGTNWNDSCTQEYYIGDLITADYIQDENTSLKTIEYLVEIAKHALNIINDIDPDFEYERGGWGPDLEADIIVECLHRIANDDHFEEAESLFERQFYNQDSRAILMWAYEHPLDFLCDQRTISSEELGCDMALYLLYIRYFIKRDYDVALSFIKLFDIVDEEFYQSAEASLAAINRAIDVLKEFKYKTKEDEEAANRLIEILKKI